MKIIYDKEKCKLHAHCRGAAPELFAFATDGTLEVLNSTPTEELREALQDAVDACPQHAISIED